jgi:glycosyltransferase involved in cell wall biosynthesis
MAPTARQIRSLRDLGLQIDVVDVRGFPKLKYMQMLPRVHRLVRRADLIHAHFGYCGWLGQMASVLSNTRVPMVISFMVDDLLGTPANVDGDLKWFSSLMVRANRVLAKRATQVIVKSKQMADVLAPISSTVIANGVDVITFCPMNRDAARREFDLPPARKYVLFPGNPRDVRKGYKLATAAIEVASCQLGSRIDLLPLWSVDPQKVAAYMNACDAMVMTSLIEGSPNVVKEAMACNVPIVGVPVGDVEELLHGVKGCEICPRDPHLIGAALFRALHQTVIESRKVLLQRGLDLESVARRIVHVYELALNCKIPLPSQLPNSH